MISYSFRLVVLAQNIIADIIILVMIIAVLGTIIYYRFMKKGHSACSGCENTKQCPAQRIQKNLDQCKKDFVKEKSDNHHS